MRLGNDRRPSLNDERRVWEERIRWIKSPLIWLVPGLLIGSGATNFPNQVAVLYLVLGLTIATLIFCFLFVRWLKLKMLDKQIRSL